MGECSNIYSRLFLKNTPPKFCQTLFDEKIEIFVIVSLYFDPVSMTVLLND